MTIPSKEDIEKPRRKSRYDQFRKGDLFLGMELLSDIKVTPSAHRVAELLCHCGEAFTTVLSNLERLKDPSCPQCSVEKVADMKIKHDQDYRDLYYLWKGMNYRCKNPKGEHYDHYGGRGITVCDRWDDGNPDGLSNFGKDMGERPLGFSIERVDVNGNYEPSNCIWANSKVQMNNVRTNHTVTWIGIDYTITELAEKLSIKPNTLLYRIRRGWSLEEAVEGVRKKVFQRPYQDKLTENEFLELLYKRYEQNQTLPTLSLIYGVDAGNLSRMFRREDVIDYFREMKYLCNRK